MYSKLLIKFLLIFIIVSCLLSGISVSAQSAASLGLSVAPQIFELDVFPGEKINQKINVGNLSQVAMPILVRVADFTAAEDSGEMLFDEASQDPSFASRFWFEIKNPNLILEAEERREVQFLINVPDNAEPGGHYAVMIFEPQLPSFYFREGQPRTIPMVGVLFLLSVKTFTLEPEIEKKLEVVEFSISKEERVLVLEDIFSRILASVVQAATVNIVEQPPSIFILRIKNNDIYHIKPKGKVLIYNLFGQKVGETMVPQMTILPGKIRSFPVKFLPEIPERLKWLPASVSNFLVRNFFVGKYQAKLELEFKSPLKTEVFQPDIPLVLTFFSLPWKFWLPFILIIVFSLFFIVKYRKRIKLAIKALFNP